MKRLVLSLKIVLPILLLLVSGLAAWALVAFKPPTERQAEAAELPKVEVIVAAPQTLQLDVPSQGVVMPREEIDLVAEIGGKIVQLHQALVPGGFFAAGDALLTIDPRDYDYAVVAAAAGVAEAKRVLLTEEAQVEQAHSEWQELGRGEPSELALHKPQLAEAQAKLAAAQADLAKARLERSRCTLRAPFAGRVLVKTAGLGQYVRAGEAVARIYASDIAEIRLPISTDQLVFLALPLGIGAAPGDWPAVTLRAEIGGQAYRWQGRIVRTEASLDNDSGQLYLVAQIADPYRARKNKPPLLTGLFVQAEIAGMQREGLYALPRSAVNPLQQVKIVAAGERLEIRTVEVLRTDAERVIVAGGLQAGERLSEWHHNGETAQGWEIYSQHDSVAVARQIKSVVARLRGELPQGLSLITWWDDSQAYDERITTLIEDGLSGFLLVCLVLTLFLRMRVALWAGAGILTSLMGAFWLMPALNLSLNMLSLFGFLLAMGILVDDAIIIGESIHSRQTLAGASPLQATIQGVQEVALPVILSVLIVLVAFLPGLFLPGWFGQMMRPICLVMILTLVFSLIEALLILPSHLVADGAAHPHPGRLQRLRERMNRGLDRCVARYYRPLLQTALTWRYLTIAGFIALLAISAALVASGRVRQSFNPDVTKDSFWAWITLPQSSAYSEARAVTNQAEKALFALRDELDADHSDAGESVIVGVETMI